jgi:hypothetical protein
MTSPSDFLEVQANAFFRRRMRSGLQGLRHAGLQIAWLERESWWRSTFTIWGSPVLVGKLQEFFGHAARRPPRVVGHYLDLII